jgi:hypothetical protein
MDIGKAGSSASAQRLQHVAEQHELDEITPVRPQVTAPRQGAVSPQLSIPGSFPKPSSTNFAPSRKLMDDARKFATGKQKMSVEQLSQRMKLEGRLLAEHMEHAELSETSVAPINFANLADELGLEDKLPKELDTLNADWKARLDEILGADSPKHDKIGDMAVVLKDLLGAQADLFSAHAAHYEEVHQLSGISDEDRADILRSELSFSAYATQAACVIPDMVSAAHNKALEIADQLEEKGNTEEAKPWRETVQQLKAIQKEILPDFKVAVDQAKLTKLVHDYQQISASSWNKFKQVLTMGLLRQGAVISGTALGTTRTFTLAALHDSPVGQLFAAGATTAVAHEVSTHLLAPALMELIGGTVTVPVNTMDVLPAPNKFVSEEGQIRARTKEELKAAEDDLKPRRLSHALSINANKVGSGTGDLKGLGSFMGVQAARGAYASTQDYGELPGAGANTVGSIAAGLVMGGIHAVHGLSTHIKDHRDRDIPAYTIKTPNKPLGERFSKVGKDAIGNLNPFVEKNAMTATNKAAGLTAGMAAAKVAEPILNAVANSSPATKAIGTALASGLQSGALLSLAWGAFSLGPQVAADRKALVAERAKTALEEGKEPAPVSPGMLDRTRTTFNNIVDPDRSDGSHAFEKGTTGRKFENGYLRWQGAGGLAGAFATDLAAGGVKAAIEGVAGLVKSSDKPAAPQASTAAPAAAASQPTVTRADQPVTAQPDPSTADQLRKPLSAKSGKPAVASGSGAGGEASKGKK